MQVNQLNQIAMTITNNKSTSNSSSSNVTMKPRRTTALHVVIAAAALVVSTQAFVSTPRSDLMMIPMQQQQHLHQQQQGDGTSCLYMSDGSSSSSQLMEKQEFEMEVGKVLDTLRSDYPDMLKHAPDYSIYDPKLVVVDPSGFHLEGISNYKQAFKLVHSILHVFYCPEKSLLTNRMIYDCTRENIRVSWNAEIVPKAIFGTHNTLHVDGISVYQLSRASGQVVTHRVEHLMINDRPVVTERGIFHALQSNKDVTSIPVFFQPMEARQEEAQQQQKHKSEQQTQRRSSRKTCTDLSNVVQFAMFPQKSVLFSEQMNDSSSESSLSSSTRVQGTVSASENDYPNLDWDAYTRKNASRKKFGLDPLTPEEYLDIEQQVQKMAATQQQQAMPTSDATEVPRKKKEKNLLSSLFGSAFEDTCESNFDCKRPEICCDFGFKKMCCSSGAMVGQSKMEQQPVRIPVTKDSGYNNGW